MLFLHCFGTSSLKINKHVNHVVIDLNDPCASIVTTNVIVLNK